MEKTKLSELGDQFRTENVIKNTYLDSDGKNIIFRGHTQTQHQMEMLKVEVLEVIVIN